MTSQTTQADKPLELARKGCSARLATSTPPFRERQRKNGTNHTIPDTDQETAGSSASLASTANTTTGAPTSHELIVPSVSIHHSRENSAIRKANLPDPILCHLLLFLSARLMIAFSSSTRNSTEEATRTMRTHIVTSIPVVPNKACIGPR